MHMSIPIFSRTGWLYIGSSGCSKQSFAGVGEFLFALLSLHRHYSLSPGFILPRSSVSSYIGPWAGLIFDSSLVPLGPLFLRMAIGAADE